MKGLILKDLCLIKGNLKTVLIVLFGFVIMLLNDMTSISFFLPFFCVMLCISTFSYDDYNKWNSYAITLPDGRKDIVKSKYLATLILVLISTAVSLVLTVILGKIKASASLDNDLATLFGGFIGVIFLMSVMYPLIYKFGSEKGRLFIFIGVFILTALGGLFFSGIESLKINISFITDVINFLDKYGIIVFLLLSLIILYISYLISIKIYKNKEF